jgi:hypothetical protein
VKKIVVALLATISAVVMSLMTFVAPASATTAMGYWWTNHSRCTSSTTGAYIDSQGQYYNYTNGSVPYVKTTRFAVTVGGHGSAKIKQYTLQENYTNGGLIQYMSSGTVSITPPMNVAVNMVGARNADRNVYVKYQVWLTDGGFCQGQWNIGQ